jgi:multiple sugar transport system permease protein
MPRAARVGDNRGARKEDTTGRFPAPHPPGKACQRDISVGLRRLVKSGHRDWIDTYQALIVPSLANPFAIFVFRQFFLTIPHELDEAMLVDGAGYYRIFWSLMLPLSGAAVATVFILTFLSEWSTLLKPLVFTTSDNMQVLQQGLYLLNRGAQITPPVATMLAGIVLVSIPPIVVFLLLQERFVQSIAATGLKG